MLRQMLPLKVTEKDKVSCLQKFCQRIYSQKTDDEKQNQLKSLMD